MDTADDPTDTAAPAQPTEPAGAAAPIEQAEPIEQAGAEPRTRRFARPTPRSVLVAVVFVAAIGLAGGLGGQLWRQHVTARAGADAERAAVAYAQVLTSIDSGNIDENFAAVLNGATGEFKDTYTKASVQLRQLLIDNKATAASTVVGSAIQSESRNRVVVLLMIDQKVTNTARPDPRVDSTRMKMTMDRVDGRWLTSKVELP